VYLLCRHIKTNGHRCQSAALRDTAFCYFHTRVRVSAKAGSSVTGNIQIPLLEDRAAIQIALTQIAGALLNSRLDARRAGLLLYALQIASQNIDRRPHPDDEEAVHSMAVTGDGEELAPNRKICEPGDCAGCKMGDICDDYDPDEEGPLNDGEDNDALEPSNTFVFPATSPAALQTGGYAPPTCQPATPAILSTPELPLPLGDGGHSHMTSAMTI